MDEEEDAVGKRMSEEEYDQTVIEWVEEELAEMEREKMEEKKAEAEGGLPIMGIAVHICDRGFRGLLGAVLDQIHARCHGDLGRIRSRVMRIEEMRPEEMPSHALAYFGRPDRPLAAAAEPYIRVSRALIDGPRAALVGVLAHELGHAVSTPEDVEVRSGLGREWGSELAADHHAARWGFGRLIASRRSGRCAAHHGPMPGEKVVVAFGEYRVTWRITEDRVPVCEGLVR